MFASVSQCAEPISQPCQLKVKVTGQGHGFEPWISCPLHISYTLEGFSLHFGHMFASVRRCAELITQPCWHKVKVTVQGLRFEPWISCPPPWSGWGIIEMAFVCPSVCPSVHPSVCPSITLFLSAPLSPEPFKRFSLNFGQMFSSVSRCAEPISQPFQLKVTGQGHGFEPWISCLLHTPGRIFFKLWSYVCLSETMWRTYNSTMPTQGQGHSSRSQVWALNFVSALYLLSQWKDFL